jgi:hypothetical protein
VYVSRRLFAAIVSTPESAPAHVVPRLRGTASPCLDRLDRLPWSAGVSFTACGVKFGVRVTDAAVLDDVRRALPHGVRADAHPVVDHLVSFVVGGQAPGARLRRFDLLYAAARRIIRTAERGEALRALESHLEQAMAELARRRLFVHAGVVGWKGRAILFPGRSHSGKSSLVAALLGAGAEYCSDEYAVLDSSGRVHPYPRPLLLRADGEHGTRVTAAALGASTARRPLPVGLVVVTHYRAGARWRPADLSPGRAMLELLGNTVMVRSQPQRVLSVLERVVVRAPALRGTRGEAEEAAPLLLRALERSRA